MKVAGGCMGMGDIRKYHLYFSYVLVDYVETVSSNKTLSTVYYSLLASL